MRIIAYFEVPPDRVEMHYRQEEIWTMIGTGIMVIGFAFLLGVFVLDGIKKRFRVGSMEINVAESANQNFFFWELPLIIMAVGLSLLVAETQHPFLLDITLHLPPVVIFIPAFLGFACVNCLRFGRLGLAERDESQSYWIADQIISESKSPDVGLKNALQFLRELRKPGYSVVSEERYLHHLVSKGESVSSIAAEKLRNGSG